MSRADEALFPAPKAKSLGGPVYQGVCEQIRILTSEHGLDKQANAGTIAQARSLAGSIDRVSGHNTKQASGMQLAALHSQLDALLERLAPSTDDAFTQLLEEMNNAGTTAPSHAAQ